MNKIIANAVLASSLALASFTAFAAPVVMGNATQVLSLAAGSNNCYQMSVAYDPGNSQYYGGGGGYTGCNGLVWNASGALVQDVSPINIDVRGVNYNANNGQIEIVSYGAKYGYGGLDVMGRDGAGLYTTATSQALATVSGMASEQSVAAYDAGRDVFYSTAYGSGIVSIARHSDGTQAGTIALAGHSVAGTMLFALGYDAANDVLIAFDAAANDALVFSLSGAFVGASHLSSPSNYDGNYSMGYANGMLFVGKGVTGGYDGFRIMEAAANVPEPATYALVLMGLLAAFSVRRMRRS